MSTSSPSIDEFRLDIKNKKVLKKLRLMYLYENNKSTLKMQVSKATSSIRRLFVSLDIYFDKYLINSNRYWNLDKGTSKKCCGLSKFRDSLQYIFFNRDQVLFKLSVKTSYEKLWWYKLQIQLQTSF